MSMRIYSTLLLLAGLAGCATGLGSSPDRASLRVEGERITIVAPEGLCIDPSSMDVGTAGGILLIGDCALFNTSLDRPVAFNAVITVGVSTSGMPGDLETLEAFLTGPGKSGLSRSRDAATVRVVDQRRTDNALLLKVRDSSPAQSEAAAQDYWRVFFPAGGRLVTGSVVPFSDAEIPDSTALSMLSALEVRTAAANSSPKAPEVVPEEVPAADAASEVTEPAAEG